MKSCSKKVFVTGITGLIGKELVEPLYDAGFEIYALVHNNGSVDKRINCIQGDLFDENFIKGVMEKVRPEYLLNMAWATTGDYLSSDINYNFLNAGLNLLKHFKGKRAVYAGTCFEYKFKTEPLKETDELEPEKTLYTTCKNELREKAEIYCKENNISFGWGRIFYVFGNGESKTRLTGAVFDKLKKNEEVFITAGKLLKDYMYTKDIAGAFVKFLDSDVEGQVNICTGKAISIRDYVLEIAKLMNKENLVVFKDEALNQPPLIVGDNTRLLNEVGYKQKYSTLEGLKEVLSGLSV